MERIVSVDGLFHEGNPASGQKGTKVTGEFLSDVQEEICNVIERAGVVLAAGTRDQLFKVLTSGKLSDVVYAKAYPTLAEADAEAVAAGKLLVISTQWDAVPAALNASIKILPGGKLNGSENVDIIGPFEGATDCFGITQAVTGLENARPEWFAPNNTAAAFARAVNSLVAGGTLRLSSAVYQSPYGTYAAPMTKPHVHIKGTKMPAFNAGYTCLENGTIIQGGLIIKADYAQVTDLGVDSGLDVVTAQFGGVAQEGFAFFDTDNVVGGAPWKSPVVRNLSALCKDANSAVHAAAFEHTDGADISNIHTVFGIHGIVIKSTNVNAQGLYARGHGGEGVIIKSNVYAPSTFSNISNVFIGSITGKDGGGFLVNPQDGLAINNINVTNLNIYNTKYGLKISPTAAGDVAQDLNFVNTSVSNVDGNGIETVNIGLVTRLNFTNSISNANLYSGMYLAPNTVYCKVIAGSAAANSGDGYYFAGHNNTILGATAVGNVNGFTTLTVDNSADGVSGAGNSGVLLNGNWPSLSDALRYWAVLTPALINSWVAYGADMKTAQYLRSAGQVQLGGTIKSGAVGSSMFVLDAGYRPALKLIFAVPTSTGYGTVEVRPDGNVVLTAGGTGFVSLDSIRF